MQDPAILIDRILAATDLARRYGMIDGDHHKMWVIDQMVRALCGTNEEYLAWLAETNEGDEGPDTYEWEFGIAP